MASSGSITTNKYNSTVGLKLTWSISSQSIANNTSTIAWTLKSNGGSSGTWWYAGPVKVVIGGKTVLNTTSRFKLYGGGAYKKTGSVVINHNDDGTKSVGMSVSAAIYTASVNCTGSNTFTLDKIDRYALITAFENFDDEGSPVITYINPQEPGIVTDLKVRVTWNNGNDATSFYALNDAGGTYTLNLNSADRDALRLGAASTNTLAVKFDLQSTMDGTNWHDTKDAVMAIVNADPTPGTVTYTDTDAAVVAITGGAPVIVQSRSTLVINTTASTPNKGASIVSYNLNINGNDYTPDANGDVTFIKPNVAGTYAATVTTTDSRGNTADAVVNITISGWTQPSALYSFERVTDFATNDAVLHVDGNISTVTGSTLEIYESHSEKGSGIWTTPALVADDTDVTISNLDYQKEYELIITVSDSFTRSDSPATDTTYTVGIGKGTPIYFIDAYRHSVAVNGIPDGDEQIFVGGTAHLKPNDTDAGVTLPHSFSTSEQIVGYWLDGRPIYEKTVELGTPVTVAAGNTSAAGTWTALESGWTNPVRVLDFKAYHEDAAGGALWTHLSANWTSNEIRVLNIRSVALTVEIFTIQYIYGTFN